MIFAELLDVIGRVYSRVQVKKKLGILYTDYNVIAGSTECLSAKLMLPCNLTRNISI